MTFGRSVGAARRGLAETKVGSETLAVKVLIKTHVLTNAIRPGSPLRTV
jgi:hypothetical protein